MSFLKLQCLNIYKSNEFGFFILFLASGCLAKQLIQEALSFDPSVRCSIDVLAGSPLFWPSEAIMAFYMVSYARFFIFLSIFIFFLYIAVAVAHYILSSLYSAASQVAPISVRFATFKLWEVYSTSRWSFFILYYTLYRKSILSPAHYSPIEFAIPSLCGIGR